MKEKVTLMKIWRAVYPLLFFWGTAVVLQMVIIIALSAIGVADGGSANTVAEDVVRKVSACSMELTLLVDVICIIIMAYLMYSDRVRQQEAGSFKKYTKVFFPKYLLVIPFSIFFMLAANNFVSFLTLFMPESMVNTYSDTSEILNNSSTFMLVFVTGIIAPVSEELMHRGVVYNRFKMLFGPMAAAVISSALFGLIHGNFVQGPYAFLIGLAAVYVYEKYKNILAPIILHISANMFSVFVSIMTKPTGEDTMTLDSVSEVAPYIHIQNTFILLILSLLICAAIEKLVKTKEIK